MPTPFARFPFTREVRVGQAPGASFAHVPAARLARGMETIAPSVRYARQRPLEKRVLEKSSVRLHCMTIPGILLALETSGQNDEELARRLQRRDPRAMADF